MLVLLIFVYFALMAYPLVPIEYWSPPLLIIVLIPIIFLLFEVILYLCDSLLWVCCEIITFLCILWCRYPPFIGIFLLESFVGLVWYILFRCGFLLEYFGFSIDDDLEFSEYSSLGWHLCFLSVCMASSQALLDFWVSIEKSCVILIGLHLYVIWLLPPS